MPQLHGQKSIISPKLALLAINIMYKNNLKQLEFVDFLFTLKGGRSKCG
jgi:hypothetical protein